MDYYAYVLLLMYLNVLYCPASAKVLKPNFALFQVERMLEEKFGPILFPDVDKGSRICPR